MPPAHLDREMTATGDGLSDGYNTNRLRSKRRFLSDEDSTQSPSKRTRMRSEENMCVKDFLLDSPEKIAPKSFYGFSKVRYLSPLERKHLKEIRLQKDSESAVISEAASSPKPEGPKRENSNSLKRRSSQKNKKTVFKLPLQHNGTPRISVIPAKINGRVAQSKEKLEKTEEICEDKPRKFFKHQRGHITEDKHTIPQVKLRKGFQLSYQHTVSGDSVKESHQDEQNVKTSVAPLKRSQISSSILDSLSKIKRYNISEGRMIDVVKQDDVSSPEQEKHKVSSETTLDSDDAESVMLLSEVSSVQSELSNLPLDSPKENKLFPIFSSKTSPSSKHTKSPISSKSEASESSPYGSSLLKMKNKTIRSSPRHILKKLQDSDGKEQMTLDFGQKLAQVTTCDGCGMTYSKQEPADVTLHVKFHKNIFSALKFPGWKKERICQENPDGSRIIAVTAERASSKKVESIRNIVDNELGFATEQHKIIPGEQTFLYISEDQQVVGCCVAQVITKGYRVIGDSQKGNSQSAAAGKPWCCSTTPEPVKCGISRIWVLASERGKKIASRLVDCVRYNFILGYPLRKEELAFSDPTPDGRSFATQYMGTSSFLVYKAQSSSLAEK